MTAQADEDVARTILRLLGVDPELPGRLDVVVARLQRVRANTIRQCAEVARKIQVPEMSLRGDGDYSLGHADGRSDGYEAAIDDIASAIESLDLTASTEGK